MVIAVDFPSRASSSASRRRLRSSPVGKSQLQGAGCLWPCGIKTCRTWGTSGKVGYPPSGSQLCPTRGGMQVEPRGQYGVTPHPITTLPGTRSATDFKEKSMCKPLKIGEGIICIHRENGRGPGTHPP